MPPNDPPSAANSLVWNAADTAAGPPQYDWGLSPRGPLGPLGPLGEPRPAGPSYDDTELRQRLYGDTEMRRRIEAIDRAFREALGLPLGAYSAETVVDAYNQTSPQTPRAQARQRRVAVLPPKDR